MLGTSEEPGIMFNAIKDLVDGINKPSSYQYTLKMWYIEVYNEVLKDLLTPVKSGKLEIREDQIKGPILAGAKEVMVASSEDIMDLLKFGNKNRTKETTWANEASSRSHAVLQVTLERRDKLEAIDADIVVAKLTLIDLAGSERAAVSKNKGMRLIEGANINRSLLALANCINALATQQSKSTNSNKENHIPYRDSKLTRLLKETLGGKCRTVMIANISPSISSYEDTLNTLKYADRAKQIKTTVSRNVLNVKAHINNYQEIINKLKSEVGILRKQLDEAKQQKVEKILNAPKSPKKKPDNIVKMYYPSEKLKEIEVKLKSHFEQEIKLKLKILEIEQESQKLGFDLFDLQLQLTKSKKDSLPVSSTVQYTKEIENVKRQIENNSRRVKAHARTLAELHDTREKLFDEIRQHMLNSSIDHEAFKFLLKNQLHDSMAIDYKRNNLYAQFLVKQRENYIKYLKSELSKSYFLLFLSHSQPNSINDSSAEDEEDKNISTMLKIENEFKSPSLSNLPPIKNITQKQENSTISITDEENIKDSLLFGNMQSPIYNDLKRMPKARSDHVQEHLPTIKNRGKASKFSIRSIFFISLFLLL